MTIVQVRAGAPVFLQGDEASDFYVLRAGKVEMLRVPGRPSVTAEEAAQGKSMGVFDRPGTPFGEISALKGEPRRATLRAVSDAVLLKVPADEAGLLEWVRAEPAEALRVARDLLRIVLSYIDRPVLAGALERDARRLRANLALTHLLLGGRGDPLALHAVEVVKALRAAGRPIPAHAAPALLEGDPTSVLPIPPAPPVWGEADLYRFLGRLLDGPDAVWDHLVADASVIWFLRRLAEGPSAAKEAALAHGRRAEEAVLALLKDAVPRFAERARRGEGVEFARRLLAELKRFRAEGVEIWGDDLPGLADSIRLLEAVVSTTAPAAGGGPPRPASAPVIRTRAEKIRVLDAVLPLVPDTSVREALARAAAGGEKDEEAAKEAIRLYWDSYPVVWRAHHDSPRIESLLFLRYGIVSADPIPARLAEAAVALDGEPTVPIYHADEWLERIYAGDFPPSRNEFDRTYAEIAAERKGRYADGDDAGLDLVRYEVDEVLRTAARMIAGGRGLPCPVLGGGAATEILAKRDRARRVTIAEGLAPTLQVDFSAFFRQVRAEIEGRYEFVLRDVFPRFLVVPAVGERAIPWQEFEGRAKEAPGRIIVPLSVTVPMADAMLDVIGRYRWELARAAAGHEWADPVHGGLSGKYFDYISFYKKNQEIPAEVRAEIEQLWAGARTNADRFAAEYRLWIRYESQGVQKLNRVSRRIFAEFAPFSRPLRERLLSHPVFGDLLRKDSNRRLNALRQIEMREKSLEKAGIPVGDVFADSKRFLEPLPEAAE